MKKPRKNLRFLALTITAIVFLTLVLAPQSNKLNSGSTYSRAPDGYGAWYTFMQDRGTPVERWQKPLAELTENQPKNQQSNVSISSPITLVRVNSQLKLDRLYGDERKWVEQGNTLVNLGVRSPVTNANFTTIQESPVGSIKIQTKRRKNKLNKNEKKILNDVFGAMIWEEELGKGKVIYASTPHLAANAYQDEAGNYQFLKNLVTQNGKSVWIDEYIHGYKDKDVVQKEGNDSWVNYLAKTPLLNIFIQIVVILLVLVIAKNRRFGQPEILPSPVVDNSKAYIQALAEILQKANSRQFVVETIAKEEQIQLQKALGLGSAPVDNQTLINAWMQETQRPAKELQPLLELPSKKSRISEEELLNWLDQWKKVQINRQ